MEEPLLSICIPTYNRADMLDYCLEGVREFERFGIPFEVVVSDNASEDDTQEVLRRRTEKMPYLKSIRLNSMVLPGRNWVNASRNASGRFVVYLADDDSLISEAVMAYVERMSNSAGLSAIFVDWIAYDDVQGREIHRYFQFPEPASFEPDNPIDLVDFVLRHLIFPETGIYRRGALLKSDFVRNDYYPHLHWMYLLSRTGTIAFELAPFYREHRVLKPQFQRKTWNNVQASSMMIGDEFRRILETIVLWAIQDAGHTHVPQEQADTLRQMIDQFLHARVPLEIRRAAGDGDWLLATELRRRLVLWHGPGTPDQQRQDIVELVLPAALQDAAKTCQCLDNVTGLLLWGFRTSKIRDFFRQYYPAIPLLDPDAPKASPPGGQPVVLAKNRHSLERFPEADLALGYCLVLDEMLATHRVNTATVDTDTL